MILHCYTSTYNDLYMIRWYVRYYSQFADKIFVYDDDSTDGTREFLDSCAPKVVVKSPGFHGIDEVLLEEMREREYKIHSRGVADFVIIGDSDELVYHPNLKLFLEVLAKERIIAAVAHGWQMFGEKAPEDNGGQLIDHIREGIVDPMYDRLIFNPYLDLRIPPGMHHCSIIGPSRYLNEPICKDAAVKMLHYKYIGLDHIKERHGRVWSRSSERNKQMGWGIHNSSEWHGAYGIDWYKQMLSQRVKCI